MTRYDEDSEDVPEQDAGAEDDSPDGEDEAVDTASANPSGFRLPDGFVQSLIPGMDNVVARIFAPFHAQMKSALPDYGGLVKKTLEPYSEQVRAQMASAIPIFSTFTTPVIDFPTLKGIGSSAVTESMLAQMADQRSTLFEGLHTSLKLLFDPELLRGFNRALLPPNLREHAGEIRAHQVEEFLEQEGIPLYLVPRGRTALRLLHAQDRSSRRRILNDCYESIMDDCAAVLERADRAVVGDELGFALDGLGAMRAGHSRSAQAMFTVTLDTLIYRFYPDQTLRRAITNRKKGADVPDAIDEMGIHRAMVWLPIWNAHEQFWKHKGDEVPRYYSRHASVHGVSPRQFSKRNCVQVLMLVTSLIGYADRLISSVARTSA